MPSDDDPGPGPEQSGETGEAGGGQASTQLVEAVIHVLVEKGVLTRNDALSIVQTVAEVQQGLAAEGRDPPAQTRAALGMLQRLYRSFEALIDHNRVALAGAGNVHHLRPPTYGEPPEFPRDD